MSYRTSYVHKATGQPLAALATLPSLSPTPAKIPGAVPGMAYSPDRPRNGGWPVPMMTSGMTFSDVGSSGLRQYGGWVREEFLPQLVGRQAARTYREMLDNSAVVGALMFSITATMRKVEWRTEPANDSAAAQEVADFVDECRDDMSHTWTDLVVEMLSMLGYGFAPHEIVYKRRMGEEPGMDPTRPTKQLPRSKYDDNKIGWRRLPLRGQDTVLKWFFGDNGEILGLTQQPWYGPLIDLPIEKTLLFRPLSHKNNPEGRSILRTAYRAWYLAKRLEEQEAILFERISGLPVIKIPGEVFELAAAGDGAALAKLESYKRIATNLRIDEQMGVILPSDMWATATGMSPQPMYSIELVSPQSRTSGVDADKSITRYNINILASVMADFLQLGHESRGTQALAISKTDMFFQAIEGFLNSGADVLNRYGVPRLNRLNGISPELDPKITPDLALRLDLDVLSNFILRLSQSGMPLFPDVDLEQWVRDAAGMPDVDEGSAARDLVLQNAGISVDTEDPNDPNYVDPNKPILVPGQPGAPGLSAPPSGGNDKQRAAARKAQLQEIVKASIIRRFAHLNGATGSSTRTSATRRRKRQTALAA